jgi:hypothetical protein
MTDPLSVHWRQPPLEAIAVDDTHALMTERTLNELAEYSATIPTGAYHGKMWRRAVYAEGRPPQDIVGWLLCWYGPHDDPRKCSINYREVLLA